MHRKQDVIVHFPDILQVEQIRNGVVGAGVASASVLEWAGAGPIGSLIISSDIENYLVLVCFELFGCKRNSKVAGSHGTCYSTVFHQLGLVGAIELTWIAEQSQSFALEC